MTKKYVTDSFTEDNWYNSTNMMGSSRDPINRTEFYVSEQLDRQTMDDLYQYDWLTRRIIEIIPSDATRKWIDISAENEDTVRYLNKKCRKFKVKKKIAEALRLSRLYGGAIMVIGVTGSGGPERPLNYDKIDTINYINVLDRYSVEVDTTYQNPLKFNYGEPKTYRLTTYNAGEGIPQQYGRKIHESRVVRFDGDYLPELTRRNNNFWHDSILQGINLSLKHYGISLQSGAVLFQDFISKVLKLPNLADLLGSDEGKNALELRLQYAIGNLSSLGIVLVGEDEEFTKIQTPIAGLDKLINTYIKISSAASKIPMTRLFGESMGTLAGATETTRTYYDNIYSYQEDEVRPGIDKILTMFLRSKDSVTNGQEVEWDFKFNSLWSETDKEVTTSRKMQEQTDIGYIESKVLTPQEVRRNRFRPDGYSFDTSIDPDKPEGEFLEVNPLPEPIEPGGNADPKKQQDKDA